MDLTPSSEPGGFSPPTADSKGRDSGRYAIQKHHLDGCFHFSFLNNYRHKNVARKEYRELPYPLYPEVSVVPDQQLSSEHQNVSVGMGSPYSLGSRLHVHSGPHLRWPFVNWLFTGLYFLTIQYRLWFFLKTPECRCGVYAARQLRGCVVPTDPVPGCWPAHRSR